VIDAVEIQAETARLSVWTAHLIEKARLRAKISKSELAARLGIPKSRVSRVLDGSANITLATFAKFGLACDVRWSIEPLKTLRRKKS
jgi:transcriptional regulator with XRE-family HTH domain